MERTSDSTITKVSDLLDVLARMGRPATLSELTSVLGFPKPTLRRLLVQLIGVGMVRQNPSDRKYRLGNRLITLAAAVLEELDVRRAATDILYDLMKATGESVYLTVLDQVSVVYVDVVESEQSVRVLTKVGDRRPVWKTATGKAMLANLDDSYWKRVFTTAIAPASPGPPTDPVTLVAQLRDIQKRGYSVSIDEAEVGVTGVAAPVFDSESICVSAVGVATPTFRFSPALEERIVRATQEAAKMLSARLRSIQTQEQHPQ